MCAHWISGTPEWNAIRSTGDVTGSQLVFICNIHYDTAVQYRKRVASSLSHSSDSTTTTEPASEATAKLSGQLIETPFKAYWRLFHQGRHILFSRPPLQWHHQGVNFVLSVDGFLASRKVWELKSFYTDRPNGIRDARLNFETIRSSGLPMLKHRAQVEAYCRGYGCSEAIVSYVYTETNGEYRFIDVEYKINDQFWDFVMTMVKTWVAGLKLRIPEFKQLPHPEHLNTRDKARLAATSCWI